MKRKFRTIAAVVLLLGVGVTMASCSKEVHVSHSELELKVGQIYPLRAAYYNMAFSFDSPDFTIEVDSWDSDHPDIATVDKKGLVQAISPGKCRITATYKETSDFCEVTVTE